MAANPITHSPIAHNHTEALARHENAMLLGELLDREPDCACRQTDADLFDARGCELHDPLSSWNVALRSVTDMQRYYTLEDGDVCPF